jgi:hypothetical protein
MEELFYETPELFYEGTFRSLTSGLGANIVDGTHLGRQV